jgi:heme-binding NEAT domain protein
MNEVSEQLRISQNETLYDLYKSLNSKIRVMMERAYVNYGKDYHVKFYNSKCYSVACGIIQEPVSLCTQNKQA